MKLRYIIATVVSAILVAGCQTEPMVGSFADFNLDKTFVSIPMSGGTADLQITASGEWAFTKHYKTGKKDENKKDIYDFCPEWITLSDLSGIGSKTIKITATEVGYGREVELQIKSGDHLQHFIVRQGNVETVAASVKEIYEGPDGKTFRVTGTCTGIYNMEYGNWYLDDGSNGTNVLTIYGTLDKDGKTKNFSSLGIEVGDVVTVEGPKSTYGSTIELVDVTVIKIEKALVKVISTPEPADKEGADVSVTLAFKGKGVYPTVSDDAKDWITYKETEVKEGIPTIFEKNPADTAIVTFTLSANTAGTRKGIVYFTSSTDKDNSTTVPVDIVQEGAIQDVSVADFLSAEVGEAQYRLTGVITKVAKAEYGNVYLRDWSGEAYIYGIGEKGDFEKLGLKEGDIVTVVGKRGDYKGDPQMAGGQYEKHFSVKDVTIAQFLEEPDVADSKNPDVYYRVSGTVSSLLDSKGAENDYGNLYITDGTNELYLYGLYPGWGASGDNRKGFVKAAGIKVGDQLTSIGYKSTYNGLIELCGGIYFSHESGEGPDNPDDPDDPDEPDEPQGPSVSDFIALDDDADLTFSAIVAAVGSNGVVVTDGKNNVYLFKPETTPAIGDKITVTATKTTYYGLIESKQGATVTVESSGNDVPKTAVRDITADFDDYPNDAPTSDFVSVTGTVAISGNYRNFNVEGASARQGSLQGLDVAEYDGQEVVLKGYYAGTSGSGGKFVVIIVTSVEPAGSAPASITIDGDMSDWANVEGVSNGSHGMFKVASDTDNLYFYTWRTTEGRFSDLWGEGAGYVYFAFDLDGNDGNGVSLNGNGPYDYIGYIFCFGGSASDPVIEITASGDCAPDNYTVANVKVKGYVDANGAYLEYSIPRADLPAIPSTPVTVTSWGNKDLSKVSITATL